MEFKDEIKEGSMHMKDTPQKGNEIIQESPMHLE